MEPEVGGNKTMKDEGTRWGSRRSCTLVLGTLLLGLAGCGAFGDDDCVDNRTYLAQKVWGPVLRDKCMSCHGPGGIAVEEGAELRLLPETYPGFLDANLAVLEQLARTNFEGESTLVRKPLGQLDHGGGAVLEPGSAERELLSKLAERLQRDDAPCGGESPTPEFDDVELLSEVQTLRKASLHLVGRLPTADETRRVRDGGEEALAEVLRAMMSEDAFYERLEQIFNDELLTELYTRYRGFAVDLLDTDDFPAAGEWFDALPEDERDAVTEAVAREPLHLINYIVRNDRPFTEVLTADYTVVNPYSAPIYGIDLERFEDPSDPNEFIEAKIRLPRDGMAEFPHAGVLTSPMFLNRFPSSPTNRNRHRARLVLDLFLATDILAISERPIDPARAGQYANPTREDPTCTACHSILDPIAGAFMPFDDRDPERYEPGRVWYQEMFPPGFDGEMMPGEHYLDPVAWLAKRIVEDPRFALAAVDFAYEGLVGRARLSFPTATDRDAFRRELDAWSAQDAVVRSIVDAFVEANYDFNTALVGVILSPYYRGANASGELSERRAFVLAEVGTGRFSPPELLDRKIKAVTGLGWNRGWDARPYLATEYEILYGGIDSDTTVQRLDAPNGVMMSVATRMANEVACGVTAFDLGRDADDRTLFPHVEIETTPDRDPTAIRENIRYLHYRVLGEDLEIDDPEIDRTYRLFTETLNEGLQALEAEEVGTWLPWACRSENHPETGEDLPESRVIQTDETYTIRAWMAVLTYLLSDYRFLYE